MNLNITVTILFFIHHHCTVLDLLFRRYQAQNGCFRALLQVLFVVLAIHDQHDTAVVLLFFFSLLSIICGSLQMKIAFTNQVSSLR